MRKAWLKVLCGLVLETVLGAALLGLGALRRKLN